MTWCLAAACAFDTIGQGGGSGDGSADGTENSAGTATTSPTSGVGSGSATSTTSTSAGSQTASASASASAEDDTTASSPTTSSTDPATSSPSTDDGSSSTTGDDGSLRGDDAVLVRYLLDQQSSGALNLDVEDIGPPPELDLAPFFDDGQPNYVEVDGNRGLRWDVHGQGGRAQSPVAGTKLEDLDGATEASFEFVVEVTGVFPDTEPFARLLVWQPDIVPYNLDAGVLTSRGKGGEFAIDFRGSWQPGGGLPMARWSMAGYSGRVVVHMLIDTLATDTLRVFMNGNEIAPEIMNEPSEGETLVVRSESFLVLGNRPANNTSFGGTIFYAAIYDRALTVNEVTHNAARLAIDDDSE